MSLIVTVIAAYFVGSLPSGYLMAKLRGIDIRREGSGNIGATNAFRVLGKPAGSVVLAMDTLKGWVSVVLVPRLVFQVYGIDAELEEREVYQILAGLAVVLGHNYTCWLGFKGGKGIATSAGVLLALVPWAFLVILIVFVVMFFLTRYVSVASISASAALPVAAVCLGRSGLIVGVTTVMAVMAILRHRSNIQRLRSGTERRFVFRSKEVKS